MWRIILLRFNYMNSNKYHSNFVLVLLLVTAFLSMQWTAVHIHLADQHIHDKSLHQHQIETHAHDLINKSVAAVNLPDQASHTDVIDLDHDANLPKKEKQRTPSSASVITPVFALPQAPVKTTGQIAFIKNTKLRSLYRPSFNPRAPPLSS